MRREFRAVPLVNTNLYDTKQAVEFDKLTESSTHHREANFAKQSLFGFQAAVKEEIEQRIAASNTDGAAALAMVSTFTKAASTKRDYSRTVEELSTYYLVDAMHSLICDEVLVADPEHGCIVNLHSSNKDVEAALSALQKEINLDQLCEDVTPDLLKYGDYTLRLIADANGVSEVIDDVTQNDVVALYRHGMPAKFLVREQERIRITPANSHLHFALGRNKLRVDLGDELGVSVRDKQHLATKMLPNYVRVGKPLLFGVQSKLKELQLLEALVPASKLHQLSTRSLVGVSIPSATEPKEAFNIARRYESLLNQKTTFNGEAQSLTTVGDIMATAGKAKVLPVFGDRGTLQGMDVPDTVNIDDLLACIRDIRAAVCASVGVPIELLFGGETLQSQGEFEKRHTRYLRKVKSIQGALANGLKQLAMTHLAKKGIQCSVQEIQVHFSRQGVSLEALDQLESTEQVLFSVSNLLAFMQDLDDSAHFQDKVDFKAVFEWIRRQLNMVGVLDPFLVSRETDEPQSVVLDKPAKKAASGVKKQPVEAKKNLQPKRKPLEALHMDEASLRQLVDTAVQQLSQSKTANNAEPIQSETSVKRDARVKMSNEK